MQLNVNIESLDSVTKLQLNPFWEKLCLASQKGMHLLQ